MESACRSLSLSHALSPGERLLLLPFYAHTTQWQLKLAGWLRRVGGGEGATEKFTQFKKHVECRLRRRRRCFYAAAQQSFCFCCCLCLCRTPMQRLCACTHVCVRVRVLRIFGSIQWPLSRRRLRRWQRRMTQGRNSDCRAINAEIDWGADLEPRAYIKLITNMKF